MQPRDLVVLADIIEDARVLLQHTVRMTREELEADIWQQGSVIRYFELIGEAARRLSPEAREVIPQIPWTAWIAMRNRLIHAYDVIDLDIVWDSLQHDLVPLLTVLEPLIPERKEE